MGFARRVLPPWPSVCVGFGLTGGGGVRGWWVGYTLCLFLLAVPLPAVPLQKKKNDWLVRRGM